MQLTIRSLTLTVISVIVVFAINLIPAGDMQTFVLALDDTNSNTTKIEYTGTPGETVKGQIVLMNPSAGQKRIQITLENLDNSQVNQNNLDSAANLYDCCKEWIVLPEGEIYTIQPNQKAVIPYEMIIPENAEAKNYYGAFIVNEIGEKDEPILAEISEGNIFGTKRHCNIVVLQVKKGIEALGLSPNIAMLTNRGALYNAAEINLYSPVFAVLAALMLATGIALGVRWCLKRFRV
jgi:hypothetical protein